jgi:hypothetical protein
VASLALNIMPIYKHTGFAVLKISSCPTWFSFPSQKRKKKKNMQFHFCGGKVVIIANTSLY